jgi:hypothetical protein
MSVLGDRYKYDVFFSYAWGTATGDPNLRDWTRAVADATVSLLSTRFNDGARSFKPYLDRNEFRSGIDLDVELKQAAESTGIFVAFVSRFYDAPYCRKEVEWFCEGLGLNGGQLSERVCVIRIQETPDDLWPVRFRGSAGSPLGYRDLSDDSGEPRSFADFVVEKRLSGLADQVREIALEIADKITSIAKLEEVQKKYGSQKPPVRPMYFLEAEPTDQPKWAECGKRIREVPSIVVPARAPKPATAMSPDEVKTFDGIVMLRSRPDDDFSRRIASAYFSRRKLFLDPSNDKGTAWIPWVLLDEVDPAPPEEADYDIPRVKLEGDDWIENLKQAMQC